MKTRRGLVSADTSEPPATKAGFLLYVLLLAWLTLLPINASAAGVIVGVNVVGVDWASDETQDALLDELQRNHVTTIRTALGGHEDRYTSFVIKAFNRGIGAVVMIDPGANNTGEHALPTDAKAGRPWGVAALSDADPKGFSQWFAPTLARLEAAHVRIIAFEFGNELNTPRFNADFRPNLISGRVMGLADLNNPRDKEAATVAGGASSTKKAVPFFSRRVTVDSARTVARQPGDQQIQFFEVETQMIAPEYRAKPA
jgi:hypothetical protein